MSNIDAILLGIVQGLTEFLPVSSSGHLVIFQKLLGFQKHNLEFDIVAHVGTLLSVLWIYRKSIGSILNDTYLAVKTKKKNKGSSLLLMVIVGSVPTALIGLGLKDIFEKMFSSPVYVGVFLCITGVLLFFTKGKQISFQSKSFSDLEGVSPISVKNAILVGVAQGLAIAPGISRSGSTISTGILLGMDRKTASMYSFLLSMPAILGALLLQLKHMSSISLVDGSYLVVGLVTSFITGVLGLSLILHFVKKGKLEFFSLYLWVIGIGLIIVELN